MPHSPTHTMPERSEPLAVPLSGRPPLKDLAPWLVLLAGLAAAGVPEGLGVAVT